MNALTKLATKQYLTAELTKVAAALNINELKAAGKKLVSRVGETAEAAHKAGKKAWKQSGKPTFAEQLSGMKGKAMSAMKSPHAAAAGGVALGATGGAALASLLKKRKG